MICCRVEQGFTGIPANERNEPVEKSWSSTEANASCHAAVKAKHTLGYGRHRVASKSREVIVSPPTLSTAEATGNYTSYGIR